MTMHLALMLGGILFLFCFIYTAALLLRRSEGLNVLQLNYRDARPIYGQIKDGLRKLIVTGALEPDEKLPSVRAMAMDLAINPNTIQRAYAELEAEGFLYSVPGKGSFAALPPEPLEARRRDLLQKLHELIAELRCLRFSNEEIITAVEEELKQ